MLVGLCWAGGKLWHIYNFRVARPGRFMHRASRPLGSKRRRGFERRIHSRQVGSPYRPPHVIRWRLERLRPKMQLKICSYDHLCSSTLLYSTQNCPITMCAYVVPVRDPHTVYFDEIPITLVHNSRSCINGFLLVGTSSNRVTRPALPGFEPSLNLGSYAQHHLDVPGFTTLQPESNSFSSRREDSVPDYCVMQQIPLHGMTRSYAHLRPFREGPRAVRSAAAPLRILADTAGLPVRVRGPGLGALLTEHTRSPLKTACRIQ